uniref:NADH dehydrogenase subunit 2 n=1 Tax=Pseudodiaptomus hessei TaxID=2919416 RepID=UPI002A82C1EB|nr:NADH dehydrogenase subunit 2 [Pseudodiaptomus hessei]WOH21603.1 NADH dehydrogenase subunit 2 [Pseudodiaptomus hessei]
MLFIFMLILTIFMAFSSTSLFFIWLSLEINMMVFLPLLISKNQLFSSDTAMKYFISQSLASILFLFSFLTNPMMEMSSFLLMMSILFKMGLAPFHSWMISIFSTSNYMSLLFLGTIQKIIPLMIISYLLNLYFYSPIIIFINLFMISFMFSNYNSIRMILFMSSINNSLFMIMGAISSNIWMMYMTIYIILNLATLFSLDFLNISKASQIKDLDFNSKSLLSFLFLNLAGIPPFLGFLQKLLIIKEIMNMEMIFAAFLLILMSLMVLYAYLMITLNSYSNSKSHLNISLPVSVMSLLLFSLTGLIPITQMF